MGLHGSSKLWAAKFCHLAHVDTIREQVFLEDFLKQEIQAGGRHLLCLLFGNNISWDELFVLLLSHLGEKITL